MPDKELQRKWRLAKQNLASEFDIPPERLHLIDTVKTIFYKYVAEYQLSDTAATALYYRLSFFSILLTVRTLNSMDVQLPEFRINDIMPIFVESKRLSSEAEDCHTLEQSIEAVNNAIDELIRDYR
jgi:hypothetical protein